MTKVVKGNLTIRVWRTESDFGPKDNNDIKVALTLVDEDYGLISNAIDALPNIAAYEVLDKEGNGSLVYPDWN